MQDHQYVMDRTSHANVADGRAWGFTAANVLDRSGSYRLAFPSDLDVGDVTMYSDDIATTYPAEVTSTDEEVDGLDVVAVEATVAATPLTDAYLRNLDQVVALPRSLSFDQLKPSLVAAGIPVDEALATLLTVATPEELATLAAFAAEPIPLQYTTSFTGRSLVEPETGAIVDVRTIVQRVSAVPAGPGSPRCATSSSTTASNRPSEPPSTASTPSPASRCRSSSTATRRPRQASARWPRGFRPSEIGCTSPNGPSPSSS